jgi:hypothetical protein
LQWQSIPALGEFEPENGGAPICLETAESVRELNGQIPIEYIGDRSIDGNSVRRRGHRAQIRSAQISGTTYDIGMSLFYFGIKMGYV